MSDRQRGYEHARHQDERLGAAAEIHDIDETAHDDIFHSCTSFPASSVPADTAAAPATTRYGETGEPLGHWPERDRSSVTSPRDRARGVSLRPSLLKKSTTHAATTTTTTTASTTLTPTPTITTTTTTSPPRAPAGIELQEVGLGPPIFAPGSSSSQAQTATATLDYDVLKRPRSARGTSALPNYQRWVAKQARRHLPLKRVKAAFASAKKAVLRIREIQPTKDGRHIPLDTSRQRPLTDERTGKPYIGNSIRSSKYNAWNFLPRQLFAQFSKLANFYFLCVSILQMIPGLSTTGTFTTIVPLLVFVSLSIAKEGYEDLRRHRLDKAENNAKAKVLRAHSSGATEKGRHSHIKHAADHSTATDGPMHWALVKWRSLQVGDIVKLERNDAAPADLLLLSSRGVNNTAYIETMALDGETNLKAKQPSPVTTGMARDIEALANAQMNVVVEDPNIDLYSFEGRVTVDGKTTALTNNEIIYRGSILRNTPECIGMVIYSGEECKIRMNANRNPRIKAPALQAVVNKIVIGMVLFVLFLSLFNSIAYQVWQKSTEVKAWYIEDAPVSFGPLLTSFIIMFNTLIPLSLYVSLEVIKLSQMGLMNKDLDMYDAESNTPFEARTSAINEELGQVGYIFSDKTGTLTENVMKFRKMSVAGTAFLHDVDLREDVSKEDMMLQNENSHSKGKRPARGSRSQSRPRSAARDTESRDFRNSTDAATSPARSASHPWPQWRSSAVPAMTQMEQSTQELIQHLQRWPHSPFAKKANMFILSIALCHTCLPERAEDGEDDHITFQASSPDELALVRAAQELGYLAFERDANLLTLKFFPNGPDAEGVFETYEVLDIIEFSSKRKRMSAIIRMPDSRVVVICKGADSVIMKRLRLANLAHQKLAEIEQRTMNRKSMEAQEALCRQNSMAERSAGFNSMPRTRNSLRRRPSARNSVGPLTPTRHDVDEWLSERETDVTDSPSNSFHFHQSVERPPLAKRSSSYLPQSEADIEELDEDAAIDETLVIERCLQHINDFATEGLRTLLYGYRFLADDEYRRWKKTYHEATTSLVNRTELIEQAGELIEQGLELGGATAIEDKLQKGVPETIDRLRRANIKIWMLTGDKRETAINIGHSCRLIKDYSSVTVLDYEAGDVEHSIAAAIIDINRGDVAHSVIVIDGGTLTQIQSDGALHDLFLDLAVLADSVICCRASPSQKAGLVHHIRTRVKRSVTLAIGDGANDIAMIQEAQVGIGITGKEGLQAARTSDYSIAQFRFLAKLLLVHGRWNYIRTCKYTVGTFYKEVLFYLTQALYQRYNGYSGTSLYENWSLSLFNGPFTSLPIVFLGIFEQDLRASTLLAVPELYIKGQLSAGFGWKVFVGWMFTGVAGAMIIFFSAWGLYGNTKFSTSNDVFGLGSMTFTACVIIISFKLQIVEARYKSYMVVVAILFSVGCWVLWNVIIGMSYSPSLKYGVQGGLFMRFGREGMWWLALLLGVLAVCLMEIALRALKCAFMPTDVEHFQTLEEDLEVRRRFEEASAMWLNPDQRLNKTSAELQEIAAEQGGREAEGQQLLRKSRTMETRNAEEGFGNMANVATGEGHVMVADGARRHTDIMEMLSRKRSDRMNSR